MELRALVNIDNPIGRWLAVPHCVVQETLDSVQDHLGCGGDDKEDLHEDAGVDDKEGLREDAGGD